MTQGDGQPPVVDGDNNELTPVTLYLQEDICRAFRRCVWSITYETGRNQLDIMQEMVHDFLVKHGC